jgi:hypothetical protein
MSMHEGLKKAFAKAGLTLKVLDKPIHTGRGMENIVQLDVERTVKGTRRDEVFRLYPGKDNLIQVRDTDQSLNQLVLLVRENEHQFVEERYIPRSTRPKNWLTENFLKNGFKKSDIAVKGDMIYLTRKTEPTSRYFLMGVDERQLFIAQLTAPATTVAGARKLLGRTVQFAEGKRRGSSADRQGEWFFLEVSSEVQNYLAQKIKKNELVIRHHVPIGQFMGRGGNPHLADELVVIPSRNNPTKQDEKLNYPVRPMAVFVRGAIRHRDHKTVRFTNFRQVIGNNEGNTLPHARGTITASGVYWID